LLERTSRGVTLTPAGKAFAVEAREVLSRVEEAVKTALATDRGEKGEIHLGYAPSPTAELLPRALHAFQNAAPGVRIVLHDNSSSEMLRGLRDGTLDLALTVRPCEEPLADLVFEPLQSYPICVAVGPAHRLARRASINLKELLDEKLVAFARSDYGDYHAILKTIFAPVGRVPEIIEECDSAQSLIAAVESLHGVAVVPRVIRCLAGGRLKIRPLEPAPAALVVGYACLATQTAPAVQRLIKTLKELSQYKA
jgi:DNA-binding transcriptional LysR family regulator